MRSMYETERTMNQCQSYIMQLRIDQKSMPPSNKKRDLKTRITEYNAKFYNLEGKFKKIQLNSEEVRLEFGGTLYSLLRDGEVRINGVTVTLPSMRLDGVHIYNSGRNVVRLVVQVLLKVLHL